MQLTILLFVQWNIRQILPPLDFSLFWVESTRARFLSFWLASVFPSHAQLLCVAPKLLKWTRNEAENGVAQRANRARSKTAATPDRDRKLPISPRPFLCDQERCSSTKCWARTPVAPPWGIFCDIFLILILVVIGRGATYPPQGSTLRMRSPSNGLSHRSHKGAVVSGPNSMVCQLYRVLPIDSA